MSKKGWALFALVGLLWGVPYLFMKVAVEELSTPVIVFSRLAIGSLLLIPVALYEKSIRPALKYWPYIMYYSVLEMVIPWYLITTAQKDLSSGLVALLVSTVPIWATLFAHHGGDSTAAHRTRIFGIATGLLGVALLVGIESLNDFESAIAIMMVLIASISYAWALNMITRLGPEISGVAINGLSMAMALVFFAPFAAINLPTQSPSMEAIGATVALGFFSTGLAFWIFFIVLREIGPARASLVVYPNTAVAVVLGIIILDEKLTLAITIGLPLVLIGSYLASKKSDTPVVTG